MIKQSKVRVTNCLHASALKNYGTKIKLSVCSIAAGVRCHVLYNVTDHIDRYLNTSVQAKSSNIAVWEAILTSYQASIYTALHTWSITGGFRSF